MGGIRLSIIILIIAIIPLIISGWLILREIKKQRKTELLLFLVIILSIISSYFAAIIHHITLSPISRIFTLIHLIPLSISSVLVIDVLRRETIEPWKLGITLFLCGALFLSLLDYDSFTLFIYDNGDAYLLTNTTQTITFTSLIIWSAIIFFNYSIMLIRKSTKYMKKYAYLFFFSLILISIGPVIVNIIGTGNGTRIPHVDTITNSCGIFLFAYILIKFPDLFAIFPFEVYRLTVLDIKSGIPVYDHLWDFKNNSMPKSVYSSLLQGIRIIVKDSMNQGEINEIRTNNSVILFEVDSETGLGFILISSKNSIMLKRALNRFKISFVQKFLPNLENRHESYLFLDAKEIVEKIFKFI